MSTPDTPQPGWYPDPSGAPGQRYWDGRQWGPTAPATPAHFAAPAAPAERRFTIHYGFALLAIFSLLGTLLIGVPMIGAAANTSDPDTSGIGGAMGILWMLWGGMWTLIWTAFAIQHTLRGRRR